MSTEHTPGRLKVGQHLGSLSSFCIHMDVGDKGRGTEIVEAVCGLSTEQRLANARRLVACWNACEGISTENLEDNLPVIELAHLYNDVIEQRDQLLKVLDCIEKWDQHTTEFAVDWGSNGVRDLYRGIARAAIAKATGAA
jgi:hypothetical protein